MIAGDGAGEIGVKFPRLFQDAEVARQLIEGVGDQGGAEAGDAGLPEGRQHAHGLGRVQCGIGEVNSRIAVHLNIDEAGAHIRPGGIGQAEAANGADAAALHVDLGQSLPGDVALDCETHAKIPSQTPRATSRRRLL